MCPDCFVTYVPGLYRGQPAPLADQLTGSDADADEDEDEDEDGYVDADGN
jgi:hypothetical protein